MVKRANVPYFAAVDSCALVPNPSGTPNNHSRRIDMKQPAPAGRYRLAMMAGIPLLLLAACSKAPEAKQEVDTPP